MPIFLQDFLPEPVQRCNIKANTRVPRGKYEPKRRAGEPTETKPNRAFSYTSPLLRGNELAGSPGSPGPLDANLCVPIPAGRPHP